VLVHVQSEFEAALSECTCVDHRVINGWNVDTWRMTDFGVERVTECYRALLVGVLDSSGAPEIEKLLLDEGVPLRALLIDEEGSADRITRSDACELAAAVSFVAHDKWPLESLHMPNVPKGSRAKSESGIDVMAIMLNPDAPMEELATDERLLLGSVKHTVVTPTADLLSKLIHSVSTDELTPVYVAQQLRVLAGRLEQAGEPRSGRVFLMLRQFLNADHVKISAVAVVDSEAINDVETRLSRRLPHVKIGAAHLRIIAVPNLPTIHERCA